MGRPLAVEVGEKGIVRVVERQRFDKQAITLAAIQRRWMWCRRDAAQQAITAAGKIWQPGCTVVDQRAVGQIQGCCRAGMAGGEDLQDRKSTRLNSSHSSIS